MENFNEIINSEIPTLVDFFGTWCGPCKMMEKPLEEIKEEIGERARVLKVDVDTNREAAAKYNVRGVPTFIIFKNGKPVWQQSGAMHKKVLLDKIKEFTN
jgi:thioredoxin 1